MIYRAVVYFPQSFHRVQFAFHARLASMRRFLARRVPKDDWTSVVGCCHQPAHLEDGLVAEVHYALDKLDHDTLAHECVHAACARVAFLGLKEQEEQIARDTGFLTHSASKLWRQIRKAKKGRKNAFPTRPGHLFIS